MNEVLDTAVPVLFLDRDGVVNVDHGYIYRVEQFEFADGIFNLCRHFAQQGYRIIVLTNQSGIGRGYYTQGDFERLTDWMVAQFAQHGLVVDGVYFCPHTPDDGCDCRKPSTGLVKQAMSRLSIDLSRSWMVGDKSSDMRMALNAEIAHRVYIGSDSAGKALATQTYNDVRAFVRSVGAV